MRSAVRWSLRGIGMIAVVAAVLALLSLAVMVLWNALVPELFHGPALQYGQAFGLLLLSRILFGGLRGRRRMWRERWESMTPEERARMREHFQRRCGHRAEPPAPQASPPGTCAGVDGARSDAARCGDHDSRNHDRRGDP